MSPLEYWRIQAIQVAAAGPYKTVGRCFYCQGEDALASFQPVAFSPRVACCRRCREARTGVPDERGLIRASATISRPLEALAPSETSPPIRGLLPAVCPTDRPLTPELVDFIFAPLTDDERFEIYGKASPSTEDELAQLEKLDRELDAMIAALDQQEGR